MMVGCRIIQSSVSTTIQKLKSKIPKTQKLNPKFQKSKNLNPKLQKSKNLKSRFQKNLVQTSKEALIILLWTLLQSVKFHK